MEPPAEGLMILKKEKEPSVLEMLIAQEETDDLNNEKTEKVEDETIKKNLEENKKAESDEADIEFIHSSRKYLKPSRRGFRMASSLGDSLMRTTMEKKNFQTSCTLRFIIMIGNMTFTYHLFPLNNVSEYAYFKLAVYWNQPVHLEIRQRDPEGVMHTVVDQYIMKEYIGIINAFGKSYPRGRRKTFMLALIPWRRRAFLVRPWTVRPLPPPTAH